METPVSFIIKKHRFKFEDLNINNPDFPLGDVVDIDNPISDLYWRNITKSTYENTWKTKLSKFKTDLISALTNNLNPSMIDTIDITGNIKTVAGFSNNLEDFTNSVSMTVARDIDPRTFTKIVLDISENQIIEIQISRNNGPYYTEYLGFIANINQGAEYGKVNEMDITVLGISKLLTLSNLIVDQAVYNQFENGIEITPEGNPTIFQTVFNNLDTGTIFSRIVENVLSYEKVSSVYPETDFEFDESKLKSINSFRTAYLLILTFYLVHKYLIQPKDYHDKNLLASYEHGEHRAYNEMLRSGAFKLWYSTVGRPLDQFANIKDVTLYDVFENRLGQIICRPPKYNELSINPVDTGGNFIGDFVIKIADIIKPAYNRNDMGLISRVDAQYLFQLIGEVPIIGSWYSDPSILFKYGLRVEKPSTNPNVTNKILARLFSSLYLQRKNALTRTLTLQVYNNRNYELGRLYLIEFDENNIFVGYLISMETDFKYGSVSNHVLSFVYVRKTERRTTNSIGNRDLGSELENIYAIYRENIFNEYTDNLEDFKNKEILTSFRTQQAFSYVFKHPNKDIVYFRVLPTILDLIYRVEEHPEDKSNQSTKPKTLPPEALKLIPDLKEKGEYAKIIDGYYYYYDNKIFTNKGRYSYLTSTGILSKIIRSTIIDFFGTPLPTIIPFPLFFAEKLSLSNYSDLFQVLGYGPVLQANSPSAIKLNGFAVYNNITGESNPIGKYTTSIEGDDTNEYFAFKTPFTIEDFGYAIQGENLISQNLINKLIMIDIDMRFPFDISGIYNRIDEKTNFQVNIRTFYWKLSSWNPIVFTFSNKYLEFSVDTKDVVKNNLTYKKIYLTPGKLFKSPAEFSSGGISINGTILVRVGIKLDFYDENFTEIARDVTPDAVLFVTERTSISIKDIVNNRMITAGYRTNDESQKIINNNNTTGKTSQDTHTKGRAIDFALTNYRIIDNARLIPNSDFLNILGIFLTYPEIQYPYMGRWIKYTIVASKLAEYGKQINTDLSWIGNDWYYHIEV